MQVHCMEDQKACKLIALSVGTVMRQSLDNDFKEACKSILGVANTNMVEETLNEKLMHIAQNGCKTSTKQTMFHANPGTSLANQEEPPQVTKAAEVKIHPNAPLSEMYRQTIQKRNHSPYPIHRTESRSKLLKCLQDSAPF